jgi:hypothetical protein
MAGASHAATAAAAAAPTSAAAAAPATAATSPLGPAAPVVVHKECALGQRRWIGGGAAIAIAAFCGAAPAPRLATTAATL